MAPMGRRCIDKTFTFSDRSNLMKDLLYYCQYNVWANKKMLQFFESKPEALLSQEIENSFPSIRKTALHILSAERSWLARMQLDKRNNRSLIDDFSSTKDVFSALVNASTAFADFVQQHEDSFFTTELSYSTWDGTEWSMLPKIMVQHCMNHSTYHRGQLITLARQLGMKEDVPSTDLLYYSRRQ